MARRLVGTKPPHLAARYASGNTLKAGPRGGVYSAAPKGSLKIPLTLPKFNADTGLHTFLPIPRKRPQDDSRCSGAISAVVLLGNPRAKVHWIHRATVLRRSKMTGLRQEKSKAPRLTVAQFFRTLVTIRLSKSAIEQGFNASVNCSLTTTSSWTTRNSRTESTCCASWARKRRDLCR